MSEREELAQRLARDLAWHGPWEIYLPTADWIIGHSKVEWGRSTISGTRLPIPPDADMDLWRSRGYIIVNRRVTPWTEVTP